MAPPIKPSTTRPLPKGVRAATSAAGNGSKQPTPPTSRPLPRGINAADQPTSRQFKTPTTRPLPEGVRAANLAGGAGTGSQQPAQGPSGRPGSPAGPARNLGGRPLKTCGEAGCEPCGRPKCHQCKGCVGKRLCIDRKCVKLQTLVKNNRKKNPKQICQRCLETFSSPSNCAKHVKRGTCGYFSGQYQNYIHVCECGNISLTRSSHNIHTLSKRNERKEAEKADPQQPVNEGQQPAIADPHLRFKMRCKLPNCGELRTLRLMAKHERGHGLHPAPAEDEDAEEEAAMQ